MTFSSGGNDQRWFRDDLKYVTAENLQTALEFVDSIYAAGGKGYSLSNAEDQFEKKVNRKVPEEPQTEVAANPWHQKEEKKWHRLTGA